MSEKEGVKDSVIPNFPAFSPQGVEPEFASFVAPFVEDGCQVSFDATVYTALPYHQSLLTEILLKDRKLAHRYFKCFEETSLGARFLTHLSFYSPIPIVYFRGEGSKHLRKALEAVQFLESVLSQLGHCPFNHLLVSGTIDFHFFRKGSTFWANWLGPLYQQWKDLTQVRDEIFDEKIIVNTEANRHLEKIGVSVARTPKRQSLNLEVPAYLVPASIFNKLGDL